MFEGDTDPLFSSTRAQSKEGCSLWIGKSTGTYFRRSNGCLLSLWIVSCMCCGTHHYCLINAQEDLLHVVRTLKWTSLYLNPYSIPTSPFQWPLISDEEPNPLMDEFNMLFPSSLIPPIACFVEQELNQKTQGER